jgi:hypothetical protein
LFQGFQASSACFDSSNVKNEDVRMVNVVDKSKEGRIIIGWLVLKLIMIKKIYLVDVKASEGGSNFD